MADESEMIGGIKVSAEVTEAGLDQSLSRIEAKLKTAAERWQGLLSVHATATGPTVAGGAAPAAPAAPLSSQVSFAKGGGTGGRKGISGPDVANAYERAIAEALAAEQGFDKAAAAATQATKQHRETVVKGIQATTPPPIAIEVDSAGAQRTVDEFSKSTGNIPQITVAVDDATARAQLTDFLAFVRTSMTEASEAATIRPQVMAAEMPPVVPPATPQAVTVPVEVAKTPEVVAPQTPQAVEVPVTVAPTPEVAAPIVTPQAAPVEPPVTPQAPQAAGRLQTTERFERLPEGFQDLAQRRLGALSEQYDIPLKLGAFSPGDIKERLRGTDAITQAFASPGGTIQFNEEEVAQRRPGWSRTMAHEFGHVLDPQIPFRARNKFMRGAVGSTNPEEFADLFASAQGGRDPHGMLPFIEGAGRTRLPAGINKLLGAIEGFRTRRETRDPFKGTQRGFETPAPQPARAQEVTPPQAPPPVTPQAPEPIAQPTFEPLPPLPNLTRDPINEYMLARQHLLENRTDETVEAFQKAAQRLKGAQDEVAEVQEEPVAPPQEPPAQPQQAPPGGAGRNVPPFEPREEVHARRRGGMTDEQRRELQELSYENQQAEQANSAFPSENAAPQLSPQEQARRRDEQARQQNQRAGMPPPSPEDEAARRARNSEFQERQNERARQEREESARRESERTGATVGGRPPSGGAGRGRGGTPPESMEEFIRRTNERQQEAVQRTLSGIFAGGRTGQVAVSGISAAALGTRAQQIRATEEQRAGRAIFQEAQKRLRFDPHDVEAAKALEDSAARIAQADQQLSNLQGFRATARNIGAIAAGAFVFSHAMSAVEPAIQAVVKAAGDWIDLQTGYASKSTAVTSALAAQTLAQKGNVDAILAQSAVTAGLSAEASDYLATQLKVTTQVKAGALAQQQASDLFRAGQGAQPTQGLAGGFGGLFGGSIFAQQLGGGKGIAEIIAGDIRSAGGGGAEPQIAPLERIVSQLDRSLAFFTDKTFRNFEIGQVKQQGGPQGVVADIAGGLGNVARIPGDIFGGAVANDNPLIKAFGLIGGGITSPVTVPSMLFGGAVPEDKPQAPRGTGAQFNPLEGVEPENVQRLTAYMNDLNSAADRGATSLGEAAKATIGFAKAGVAGQEEIRRATQAAIDAGNTYALTLAQESRVVLRVNGEVADTADELNQALQQIAVGKGIPDPEQLGRLALAQERQRQVESRASVPAMRAQFEFERPAAIAAANREQQFAQQVQIPANAALTNLANPLPAVGTGIVAANAEEQERIRDATKETVELQDKLNSYYDAGKQILLDTYQIPPALINSIQAVGQQIAATQAGIRNEQAAYQVEQYNYQLRIARRTLADIGGLTGRNFGEGQSYLGVLEKQNLALSRQAQLLQFSMQQRQINFQVALAGFQAPGVTPEERQARVKEAEIEASFAQKQLNIQRQMFGNQVQIVDIQNLRQGADLAAQIGLLLQGRKLTIDTAVAEEKLLRLQKVQAEQIAQAGTYIEKVNKLTGRAFSEIQALETAAGEAMINASQYALDEFGITLDGMVEEFNSRVSQPNPGPVGGFSGGGGGIVPAALREEELVLDTTNAQKQLGAINEQQEKIADNVGGYLADVTKTVTKTSRQVNKLEGEVGDALGRATTAQVNALNTYFTSAAEQWSAFFAQVATTSSGGNQANDDLSDHRRHASGYVGMTTGSTMTGVGMMGEAGQEAYAILKNPKAIMDFGDSNDGGNTYIIQFNNPVVREENDIDKLAQKVMALTGREAALRGLRSVS